MFGRFLCFLGWHDWAYSESGCTFHLTRKFVLRNPGVLGYRCIRCGEEP